MTLRRFEVFWAQSAIRDLEEIVDFVEREAPMAAQKAVRQDCKTLENPGDAP